MRMDNKDIPDPILSLLATQKHTPKISCFHKNSISLNSVLEEEQKLMKPIQDPSNVITWLYAL